jgi:DNA polymerase (family X)
MTNSEIVETLELTARLLELHEADAFKIRAYSAAAFNLDKLTNQQIAGLSFGDLIKIQGVGKGVAGKIIELVEKGHIKETDELLATTPPGVLEMFKIKGIGPKKIAALWHESGIETIAELEAACLDGRIAKLKGFGEGTQQKILDSLAFLRSQTGKLRMNQAESLAQLLLDELEKHFDRVEVAGEVRRKTETVETLRFLIPANSPVAIQKMLSGIEILHQDLKNSTPFVWRGKAFDQDILVEIVGVPPVKIENEIFIQSSAEGHLTYPGADGRTLLQIARQEPVDVEEEIYQKAGLPYIVPEMREGHGEFTWAQNNTPADLVTWDDLKGILHNHSTYSDGQNSLEEMAEYCRELGFEYLGIADHSQTAAYASGMRVEKIFEQHDEIDRLNARFAAQNPDQPFKILKGIESDILGDGALDYPDAVLASFDYIVASVHSNLTMSLSKATDRLLTAIANPYTTILGHPTGRLLLSRDGYPLDYKAIIDACAEHKVVVEINASPWRLDLDWRWVGYCLEKGVMLSINPDAHATQGYHDMHYGVAIGRKGGLTKGMTFNALSLKEMEGYLQKKKQE